MTENDLIDHWLSQPDFREIAEEMEKSIRNPLDRDGLLALFNADIYRELCPETKEMKEGSDFSWLASPILEIAEELEKSIRNPLDRDGLWLYLMLISIESYILRQGNYRG